MARKKKEKTLEEKFKDFIIEKKKRIIYASIIVLAIFLVLFFTGIKVRFLLSDEMNIKISPLGYSFETTNNQSIYPGFTIKNENFALCRSYCEIILRDLSKNNILFYENITLTHNEEKDYSFTLNGSKKGSGQKLFRFSTECNNMKSAICFTDQEKRYKNVVILNTYSLQEYQEELKKETKKEVEEMNILFLKLVGQTSRIEGIIDSIPMDIEEKQEEKLILDMLHEDISSMQIPIETINSLWENESFENIGIDEVHLGLVSFNQNISKLWFNVNSTVSDYTSLIDHSNQMNELHDDVDALIEYHNSNSNSVNDEKSVWLVDMIKESNSLNNLIHQGNFSLSKILVQLSEIKENIGLGVIEQEENNYKKEYYSYLYYNLLRLRGEEIEGYTIGNSSCDTLSRLYGGIIDSDNESINSSIAESFDNDTLIRINKEFMKTKEYDPRFNDSLVQKDLFYYNKTSNSSLLVIKENLIYDFIGSYCGVKRARPILVHMELFEVPDLNDYPINISDTDFELDNKTSRCCVLEHCSNCINDPGSDYPILFIHGHIMNEKNSPEYSMQAFAKIQKNLENDGFLNMGEFKPDDYYNLEISDWGYVSAPISVRSSYYYVPYTIFGDYKIVVEKSEKIENYALRLNELIELIKMKTGKEKVNIIAHSMGGLVIRQYISLFGSSSIDKVITINTPHQGITDRVEKYCGVFGSDKECNDMVEGSIFLAKLNSKKTYENIYVIRSKGCNMEGKDGDGIVTFENSYLQGAKVFEIEGKCTDSLQTDLHTNVLDIDKYPRTYEIIISILEED